MKNQILTAYLIPYHLSLWEEELFNNLAVLLLECSEFIQYSVPVGFT